MKHIIQKRKKKMEKIFLLLRFPVIYCYIQIWDFCSPCQIIKSIIHINLTFINSVVLALSTEMLFSVLVSKENSNLQKEPRISIILFSFQFPEKKEKKEKEKERRSFRVQTSVSQSLWDYDVSVYLRKEAACCFCFNRPFEL